MTARRSIWTPPPDTGSPLEGLQRADVCVVGGGIAGLAIARTLSACGAEVILLESRDGLAGGETGASTAHLVTALDRGWHDIVAVHGREHAQVAAASHAAAIGIAESLVRENGISCGFERVDGYLVHEGDGTGALAKEAEAALLSGVRAEWSQSVPGLQGTTECALRYPEQAQMDPVAFCTGLARAARAMGCRIHTGSHVTRVDRSAGTRVLVRDAAVICDRLVLATNAPIDRRYSLDAKQAPYRTYVVAATVRRGAVPRALYWDTAEPFHFVRVADHPTDDELELLLVGGEDHKTGQDAEGAALRYGRLEGWGRRRFPAMETIVTRWSGQVVETMDGLGFIGLLGDADTTCVATGDCGNGMTHALIASVLVPDLIQGKTNPWAPIYDPQRIRLRALGDAICENANTLAQLTAWITGGDGEPADVAPGSEAVVRRGVSRVAVYRDPDGRTVELSAVCPHLGCIVRWNGDAGSWDCPCHGSRFDPRGRVMSGPAMSDLRPAESEAGPGRSRP